MSLTNVVEEWKDIVGFEGRYQISSFGRVKSLERTNFYLSTNQTGIEFQSAKHCSETILKTFLSRGYEHISLKKGSKSKTYSIHRLVAEHFIPNPNNYPVINHKDENKFNNRVDNLEWCTQRYNSNYGTRNKRIAEKLKDNPLFYIPVLCYDLNNNFVKRYESAVEASKDLGIRQSGITACCRLYYGRTSSGGYKWKYEKTDTKIEDVAYVPQKKQIHQLSLNGEFIATYECIADAARAMGKNVQNFTKYVRKHLAYDYVWIVGDNYEKVDEILKELEEKKNHILQIDDNGNVVARFKSALEAETVVGINHSNICHAILSKTKEGKLFRKAAGFYWVDIIADPYYQIDFKFKKSHGEKTIIQCDLEGKELREFSSIADAQEFLGIDRRKISVIYDCINKPYKAKRAYGYKWIRKK